MTNISIPQQEAIFRPLNGLAIARHQLSQWLTARREKLDQRLLANRLEQLRQRAPHLYADLRVTPDNLQPPLSALPLIPHAVVAGYFMEE